MLLAARYLKHPKTSIEIKELCGWTPIEVKTANGKRQIEWGNFKDVPFVEPFFYQTIEWFRSQEICETVVTDIEALDALRDINPGLHPNGFIFHTSHCGSTVVSNMLAAVSRNLSVSEPAPLNTVLLDRQALEEDRSHWIRGMVSAYGQRRLGTEESFTLKLNSWHLFDSPKIRAVFPNTPVLCVYRHPVEILAGQFRRTVLNTYWLNRRYCGLERCDVIKAGLAETAARTLGRYYDIIRQIATSAEDCLLVNYNQLSRETYSRILEHFSIETSREDLARVGEVTRFYSKDPSRTLPFTDDSETKQREVPPIVYEVTEKWAMDPYRRLASLQHGLTRSA